MKLRDFYCENIYSFFEVCLEHHLDNFWHFLSLICRIILVGMPSVGRNEYFRLDILDSIVLSRYTLAMLFDETFSDFYQKRQFIKILSKNSFVKLDEISAVRTFLDFL